jgi:long-chain acyl-CoA synthetase
LGKAIRGQEIRIAADGEILVRGESVVGDVDSEGWFHTGDIGEIDQEGLLYYKGRKKDVIVTPDGMNVYPEDVETVLNALPQVRSSVVVSRDDEVHAVVIPRESTASMRAVVAEANRRLEPHQQIRGWTVWRGEDFPRTASTLKVRRAEVERQIEGGVEAQAPPQRTSRKDVGLMSSLERVDLLAELEQRYGVELDEDSFSTVNSNEALKTWISTQTHESPPLQKTRSLWAVWPPVRVIGNGIQRFLALPLLRHYLPLRVHGLNSFRGLRPPVIFASNHTSHLDTPAIFAAFPSDWRRRLAPAARQEQFRAFFDRQNASWKEMSSAGLQYFFAGLIFNAYPLPQRMSGVRRALKTTGELISRGYCPLIFPEGERTPDGLMHEFQPGVGLMAVRLRIPVVPIFVRGLYEVYSMHDSWPKPGPVDVFIGEPIKFSPATDYADAARQIESAVRGLGN